MANMSYKDELEHYQTISISEENMDLGNASYQSGLEFHDEFTINPVFDVQEKQRKFNAYLVDEEHVAPNIDKSGETEYGIAEGALNAHTDVMGYSNMDQVPQHEENNSYTMNRKEQDLNAQTDVMILSNEDQVLQDVDNDDAKIRREERDLLEVLESDFGSSLHENSHLSNVDDLGGNYDTNGDDAEDSDATEYQKRVVENVGLLCEDENGIENFNNTGINRDLYDATENKEDAAKPVFFREESFKRTCFPQLWARIKSGERENAPKVRKKTVKGRRSRARGCKSASSVASWATGFMSNSDVSLISTKPSKLYSGTYDIRYSSTSLILLNNRLRQEIDRLRHSDRSSTKTPRPVMDPGRHSRASSAFSPTHHMHCYDSNTPKPEFPSSPTVQWLKSVTTPKFLEKHSFNTKRHRNCVPLPEKTFILDSSLPDIIQPERTNTVLSPYAERKTKK